MSSQLTCGSKRVAKMLASRLRFTERRPLPWPFPVTHVFFLGRAPVDFTRDGCVVFCRRRTTVVHSIVVGTQTDVDDAQTDVDGAQSVMCTRVVLNNYHAVFYNMISPKYYELERGPTHSHTK